MTDQSQINFENMSPDALSDHIVNTHHAYIRKAIPSIKNTLVEAVKNNVQNHSELAEISKTFENMATALEEHMAGEEKYLFPFVKKMLNAQKEGNKIPQPPFGALSGPLKNHIDDHDKATDYMEKINEFSNNFTVPSDADDTYKTLYKQLGEFEADLKQHIHLENEILFEKCYELEKATVQA